MNKTIFALATPANHKSGVAIVRISGEMALNSLTVFGINKTPKPRMATLCELKSQGETIDKSLLFYFNSPHSFTGEDVIEIHCHGGRAVIAKILSVLASVPNFRMAEAGEFSKRAFFNNKMDLTAAEGLADLIDADTEGQRKQALRIMQGDAAVFYEKLRGSVLHSLAYLEAYIDFPDEDIPESVLVEIDAEIASVSQLIKTQLSDNFASEKIRDGIFIAILGSPNVGKSSLLNLLAKRDVAIVSNIAGTTRDVIEVNLDIKGYSVILADTAGIRENADIIEQEGIRRSFERAKHADIKIIMLDAESSLDSVEHLIEPERTIILFNKVDLVARHCEPSQTVWQSQDIAIKPIKISVKERTGIDQFMQDLENMIAQIIPSEASFVTRTRHREHLSNALEHLHNYQELQQVGLEIRSEELRRAATEIGKITGKIAVDEILGHIFSSFCIGK